MNKRIIEVLASNLVLSDSASQICDPLDTRISTEAFTALELVQASVITAIAADLPGSAAGTDLLSCWGRFCCCGVRSLWIASGPRCVCDTGGLPVSGIGLTNQAFGLKRLHADTR